MELLRGFLFVIGGVLGFVFILFVLALILKATKKKVHATAKVWREYLLSVIAAQNFDEAARVTNFVLGKKDDEEIITPPGYKIDVERDITIDENGDGPSKIKVNKNYKIIKQKDGKSNA